MLVSDVTTIVSRRVVAPLFHKNVVPFGVLGPPKQFNTTVVPEQMGEAGFDDMVNVGGLLGSTLMVAVAVQPFPSMPVIVYCVLAAGAAITVAPLLTFKPVEGNHV